MTKVKFISFVPWVTIGGIIGSLFIVPMMPKIVDALYYKNKYNNDASKFYKKYIEDSVCVKVVIPDCDSELFLHNSDDNIHSLGETFITTYDSKKYFSNPSADYRIFYSKEYKKYLNIIAFQNV